MNITMAILAAQLLLYAAAWLVVGLIVQTHRQASLSWAAGWTLSALTAALLYLRPSIPYDFVSQSVNVLIISSFLLVYRGTVSYAQVSIRRDVLVFAYAGVIAIEVARWLLPQLFPLRVWIFTVVIAAPMIAIIHLLWTRSPVWFQPRTITQVILVSPVALTLVLFLVRSITVTFTAEPHKVNLDSESTFDLVLTTSFFFILGFFNFSLFALVLRALVTKLEELSSKDQLTGLNNRRVMMERLAAEHSRFKRHATRFALVMMDLDHFKLVNDRYGHVVGDEVLGILAQRFQKVVRNSDFLARIGGEEFLLLVPESGVEGASSEAERIRVAVAESAFETSAGSIQVTISSGVTVSRLTDNDALQTMGRADHALYQAKAQGRNCVRVK